MSIHKQEIRRLREAQNLLSLELARRMGVSPARISVLERGEQRGAVTLKMMSRTAAALGCEFVYSLVPKDAAHESNTRSQQSALKPRLKLQKHDTEEELDSRMRALVENSSKS